MIVTVSNSNTAGKVPPAGDPVFVAFLDFLQHHPIADAGGFLVSPPEQTAVARTATQWFHLAKPWVTGTPLFTPGEANTFLSNAASWLHQVWKGTLAKASETNWSVIFPTPWPHPYVGSAEKAVIEAWTGVAAPAPAPNPLYGFGITVPTPATPNPLYGMGPIVIGPPSPTAKDMPPTMGKFGSGGSNAKAKVDPPAAIPGGPTVAQLISLAMQNAGTSTIEKLKLAIAWLENEQKGEAFAGENVSAYQAAIQQLRAQLGTLLQKKLPDAAVPSIADAIIEAQGAQPPGTALAQAEGAIDYLKNKAARAKTREERAVYEAALAKLEGVEPNRDVDVPTTTKTPDVFPTLAVFVGSGIGAILGMLAGTQVKTKNAAQIGAAVGTLLGGIAGYATKETTP